MMYKYINFIVVVLVFSYVGNAQNGKLCKEAIPIYGNTVISNSFSALKELDKEVTDIQGCLNAALLLESEFAVCYTFKTTQSGQFGFNIQSAPHADYNFSLFKSNDCSNLNTPIRCNAQVSDRDTSGYTGVGVHPLSGEKSEQYEDWLEISAGETYFLFIQSNTASSGAASIQFSGAVFNSYSDSVLDKKMVTNLLGSSIVACEGKEVVLDASASSGYDYQWWAKGKDTYQSLPEKSAKLVVTESGWYKVVTAKETSEVQVTFVPKAKSIGVLPELVECDGEEADGLSPFTLKSMDDLVLGVQKEQDFHITYHANLTDAQRGIDPLSKSNYRNKNPYGETIFARKYSSLEQDCAFEIGEFELIVVESPLLEIEESVSFCTGEKIEIGDADGSLLYEYLWSTGETTPTIVVSEPGVYGLLVNNKIGDANCTVDYEIEVVAMKIPVLKSIDVNYRNGENSVKILMKETGGFEYSLDGEDFTDDHIFYNVEAGEYDVHIRDVNGCGVFKERVVVVGMPKVFTPNGDGINDYWHLQGIENINQAVVYVVDRNGMLLAQLDKNHRGWDGTFKGQVLPESDYWFRLEYTSKEGNKAEARYLGNHFSLRR